MTATIYQFPVRAGAVEARSVDESIFDPAAEQRICHLVTVCKRAIDNPQTVDERRFAKKIELAIKSHGKA